VAFIFVLLKKQHNMKKTMSTVLLVLVVAISAHSQTTKWIVDDTHAKIGFKVTHFGISETEGKFTKFSGTVLSDKADFADAKIDLIMDANSVDTDNDDRDKHLKTADFFDTSKYPDIVFKSKSIESVSKNKYRLRGDLTMHGVTKEILLDAVYRGTVARDPFGNTKAGFKISGLIDRTQWGLNWGGALASGDLLVGNDVMLECNVELTKLK
jgi:polyisoprenoid-binding protein YceI